MIRVDSAFCPHYHRAVELVGWRWTGAVLRALLAGASRFGEIKAVVPGLSDRLLARRLKELEAKGILTRTVMPETPVRIDYRLTVKGQALGGVVGRLSVYADRWLALRGAEAYRRVRRRYPARTIPVCYYLYALPGALDGVPRDALSPAARSGCARRRAQSAQPAREPTVSGGRLTDHSPHGGAASAPTKEGQMRIERFEDIAKEFDERVRGIASATATTVDTKAPSTNKSWHSEVAGHFTQDEVDDVG